MDIKKIAIIFSLIILTGYLVPIVYMQAIMILSLITVLYFESKKGDD